MTLSTLKNVSGILEHLKTCWACGSHNTEISVFLIWLAGEIDKINSLFPFNDF